MRLLTDRREVERAIAAQCRLLKQVSVAALVRSFKPINLLPSIANALKKQVRFVLSKIGY